MQGAVALGSDHAGYRLKEHLKVFLESRAIPFKDFGCYEEVRCDYPQIAEKIAQAVQSNEYEQGILCCGSGIGMAMSANRFAGARAVVCIDAHTAMMSRLHNDANIICFGGRVIAWEYACELFEIFRTTPFEGGRHQDRVNLMDNLGKQGDIAPCS